MKNMKSFGVSMILNVKVILPSQLPHMTQFQPEVFLKMIGQLAGQGP